MIYIVLALIFLAAVVRWDTPATAIVSRSGRTTDDHPRRHHPAHGARHHSCALAANKFWPSRAMMERIVSMTRGEVTPNDFLGVAGPVVTRVRDDSPLAALERAWRNASKEDRRAFLAGLVR